MKQTVYGMGGIVQEIEVEETEPVTVPVEVPPADTPEGEAK